jgi:hypothetical protein
VPRRAVQLVAEAAAATLHDLGELGVFVQDDGPAEADVQVLERHRLKMRLVQAAQRLQRGAERAAVVDAAQVRGDVTLRHSPSSRPACARLGDHRSRSHLTG